MPFELCRSFSPVLVALAILAVVGCAGQRFPYETVAPKLEYSGRRAVAVAVRDGREQIVAGRRDPSVVGEALVAGARKSPIVTGNGEPLASIVAAAVTASLEAGGFSPVLVETAPGEDREAVVRRALDGKPDYLWLIDIDDWWTARHKATTHTYKLAFAVLDADGAAMVERSFEDTVRWNELGEREGAEAEAEEPDEIRPPPAPVETEPPADPDAFDHPPAKPAEPASDEAPDAGEVADGPPAPEPEPEPAGDPVARTLTALLGDLLERMINDPEVPKRMVRFP